MDYLDENLTKDKDFITEYIDRTGYGFKYATKEQQNDKELILSVIEKEVDSLKYADKNITEDKAFMLELMRKNGYALEYAKNFQNDKEMVFEAVSSKAYAFTYASAELQKDKSFILELLKANFDIFDEVNPTLFKDKEFLLSLIKETGHGLQYASKEQQANKALVLSAVKKNGDAINYCSQALKNDREVALEAVKEDGYVLEDLNDAFRKDREIVLASIDYAAPFSYAHETLKADRAFVKKAIDLNGYVILYASESLQKDRELAIQAVETNSNVFVDDNFKFRLDKEIAMIALRDNKWLMSKLDKSLQEDEELMALVEEVDEVEEESFLLTIIYLLALVGFLVFRKENSIVTTFILILNFITLVGFWFFMDIAIVLALISLPLYLYKLSLTYSRLKKVFLLILPLLLGAYMSWALNASLEATFSSLAVVLMYLVFWIISMIVYQVSGNKFLKLEKIALGIIVMLLVFSIDNIPSYIE